LNVDQQAVRLSDVLQQAAPALSHYMANYRNRFRNGKAPRMYTPRHMSRAMAAAEQRQAPPRSEVQGIAAAMSFGDVNKLLLLSDTASKHLESEDSTTDHLSTWELPLVDTSLRAGALPEDMDARSSLRLGEDSELTAANVIRLLSRNLEQNRDIETSRIVAGEYVRWASAVSSMTLQSAADTERGKKAG